ncbi:MAG: hypothetical protein B7Y76_11135 [Sphingobacteriia bacterium 35-40-5]|nr:MAG: hypothetical protein B7Y76_11135 [Sphingobacteriia bacterium 35-40-5]
MKPKLRQMQGELDQIVKAMGRFMDWENASVIREAAGLKDMELRTFQRRLDVLKKEGKIEKTGSSSDSRYRLINVIREDQPEISGAGTEMALSPAAQKVLWLVSIPLEQRTAVGYNIDWVKSYQPNEDFYLSAEERDQLRKSGTTTTIGQPAGTYAKQMLQRLLIDLSWNSSRLEGNTYSLLDTQRLVADNQVPSTRKPKETQMILNHKDAIEFIVQNAGETGLNPYTIRNLHGILSYNLLPDPSAPGRLRQFGVGISHSSYSPLAIPQQIAEIFTIILQKAASITDPYEQAFFVMVHLPYLQPFEDVNKRVSRLAANIPLNRHNLVPLSFIDVPVDLYLKGMLAVYELNDISLLKEIFLWAYGRSVKQYSVVRQTLGEPDPFRLQYSGHIRDAITEIISQNVSKEAASQMIANRSQAIPVDDRTKFSTAVEQELLSLHEGNFARYRVTPSMFKTWQDHWQLNKKQDTL